MVFMYGGGCYGAHIRGWDVMVLRMSHVRGWGYHGAHVRGWGISWCSCKGGGGYHGAHVRGVGDIMVLM